MKQIGIVKDFDNYNGSIYGLDFEIYKLLDKEIIDKNIIKKGDTVLFDKETIKNETVNINLARFVKKINNNNKK